MHFLSIVSKKQLAMFGGILPAVIMLATLCLCFFSVDSALQSTYSGSVRVLVFDEDCSDESHALFDVLLGTEGLAAENAESVSDAKRELSLGRAEGLLIVLKGYEAAVLSGDTDGCLRYESALLSSSGQAVREIVSGAVARRRVYALAFINADELTGGLSEARKAALTDALSQPLPAAYTVRTGGNGAPVSVAGIYSAFSARYMGFAALCIMLCMLALSASLGNAGAISVNDRLRVLPHGRVLALYSDICALYLTGILVALPMLLPMKTIRLADMLFFAAYIFCVSGLCLLITRFGRAAGCIDVISPFAALITGLLGGCFIDISAASPVFHIISLFTPQGLLLEAISTGEVYAPSVLIAVGALCIVLSRVRTARNSAEGHCRSLR